MQANAQADQLNLVAEDDFLIPHAGKIQEAMRSALASSAAPKVHLDLSNIKQMDSVGLKLLLGLYQSCQRQQRELTVRVGSPSVLKLIELCRLNQLITLETPAAQGA